MLASKASEVAKKAIEDGYNCCEAILLAANSVWNLELDKTTLSAANFFEEGIGSGCTCGALVGMVMVSGILNGKYKHSSSKKLSCKLHNRFKQEFGSTCCRVINKNRSMWQKIRRSTECINLTAKAAVILVEEWAGEIDESAYSISYNSNL